MSMVEVEVLGQCGDFMQKLSTFSEALARFPVSHVLVSNGVVNITTLPSFRRMFTKQCHQALAHTSSSQLLVNTKMYSSLVHVCIFHVVLD